MNAANVPESVLDSEVARENGRRMAVQAMLMNPEAKKRVEDAYGLDYCKRVYPELYTAPSRWARLVNKVTKRG